MKKIQRIIAILVVSLLAAVTLTACGDDSKKATEGLEYKAMEDGTYAITGYTGDDVNVYIPAEYNDVKVTVIEEEAFAGTEIQSISGGKNIVSIGEKAFETCYMLKSFDLEGDITVIDERAFSECKTLESVKLPETLTEISRRAFDECEALKTITIPEGVETIGEYAFDGCISLESVKLPESLTSIENDAFQSCENLKEIELPESLEEIGSSAFKNCNSLQSITIPANVNKVGSSVFYSTNGTMTVTVEGSIYGWSSNWNYGANVIYNNGNKEATNVTVKNGTYKSEAGYVCINDNNIEIFDDSGNVLANYTYDIDGNTLRSVYDHLDLIYDEDSVSITWPWKGETYVWINAQTQSFN